MAATKMDLNEQLEVFDGLAKESYEYTRNIVQFCEQTIMEQARERFKTGCVAFGDQMFTQHTSESLFDEVIEELADAVAWGVGKLWQDIQKG